MKKLLVGSVLSLGLVVSARGQDVQQWQMEAPTPATWFGAALCPLGDLDRDGKTDLAVSAPRFASPASATGQVAVLSGRDGSTLATIAAPVPSSWFGTALAAGGDWNGDGTDDLAVGAPLQGAGRVHVYSGEDLGLLATLEGADDGDRFGSALAFLGDIDGDGRAELAVTAPHSDGAGWNAGEVRVLRGEDSSALFVVRGQLGDFLGTDLDATCDVNGDGHRDLLIGSPFADAGGFNSGSVQLVSGATGARLREFSGEAAGDWFGTRVANLGDLDGDGQPECGVGAPGSDRGGIDSGAVHVISCTSGKRLLHVPGERTGEYLQEVAQLGDTDGDGGRDFMVGSVSADFGGTQAGRVRVLSGEDATLLVSFRGTQNDWLGAAMVWLPHPDGTQSLAIGAPGYEDHANLRGYVRVLRATRSARPEEPNSRVGPCD